MMYELRGLSPLWVAALVVVVCFNASSVNAMMIQNFDFSVTPTMTLHGDTATANVSFDFFRMGLWGDDWGTIKFQVEIWEDDAPLMVWDDLIGAFGGPGYFPGDPDAYQIESVTMTPFTFVPHSTAGMHTFGEGDTIELYAYIRDMGGTSNFSNVPSDIVKVSCVPAPGALILGVLGLGTSLKFMRKRRML